MEPVEEDLRGDRDFRIALLAWISTEGNSPNIWAFSTVLSHVVSRSGTPFHQGTFTGLLRRPEAMTMGKWARR